MTTGRWLGVLALAGAAAACGGGSSVSVEITVTGDRVYDGEWLAFRLSYTF